MKMEWKRRWIWGLSCLLCLTLLAGCGQGTATSSSGSSVAQQDDRNLSVCLGDVPETLDPIRATTEQDQTVIEHLYENLMRKTVDTNGAVTVTAGLAKDYTVEKNNGGTVTYTFTLRSANWSDGQAVTAADFVYAWQRLADPGSLAPDAEILSSVVGYDEVQRVGDPTKLQVQAPDETTLVVTLVGDCPWFLTDTCTAIATMPLRQDVVQQLKQEALTANEEAVANGGEATQTWSSDPTKLVTNGPYLVSAFDPEDAGLIMAVNDQYYGNITGPTTLQFYFAASPEQAWSLYENKTVNLVWPLPAEQLEAMAKDQNWAPVTKLSTSTLLFNTQTDPFSDPRARQAFSLAVDRTALSKAYSVTAQPAVGLVPYGVPQSEDGDFRTEGGDLVDCDPEDYEDNCTQARAALSQAGYDTGADFPTVECLYEEGAMNQAAADALVQIWSDALGVQVNMSGLASEDFQQMIQDGNYSLAIGNVEGLVNDAESFLTNWTSNNPKNVVGYYNSAYDTLLTIIHSATDATARLGCLHDAESLLLEDGPLTPLYFNGTAWKLREDYVGLYRDGSISPRWFVLPQDKHPQLVERQRAF